MTQAKTTMSQKAMQSSLDERKLCILAMEFSIRGQHTHDSNTSQQTFNLLAGVYKFLFDPGVYHSLGNRNGSFSNRVPNEYSVDRTIPSTLNPTPFILTSRPSRNQSTPTSSSASISLISGTMTPTHERAMGMSPSIDMRQLTDCLDMFTNIVTPQRCPMCWLMALSSARIDRYSQLAQAAIIPTPEASTHLFTNPVRKHQRRNICERAYRPHICPRQPRYYCSRPSLCYRQALGQGSFARPKPYRKDGEAPKYLVVILIRSPSECNRTC